LTRLCRRCLYPASHPLGITFDAEGICSGCRIHEEKDRLDWTERGLRLAKLLGGYRGRVRGRHDCIVPVSGGRDSFFIVHMVRKVYGLNPLLVVYNRHYNSRAGIFNIERLRTVFGCDIVTLTLDPERIRRIMRGTLAQRGSFHWHALAGQTVFPVQQAVRLKIPLVIWGAHQGLEQVGMFSHLDEVEMSRRYRREHDLMSLEPEDMVDREGLSEADLKPLFYPTDHDLRRSGVRGIYLGNYLRWDTKAQHERMVELYDYYAGSMMRTFDTYNDVDDLHFTGAHDLIKFRKLGYGKATDDACREIRFGRLSRDEGIQMVDVYQRKTPSDFKALADFIGLNEQEILGQVTARCATVALIEPCDPGSGQNPPDPSSCIFGVNTPSDFTDVPQEAQLLTRGYSRETGWN
jgi:N-acetyl sugar amidotransferase